MINTYDIGDKVVLETTVEVAGVLTDATMTCSVRKPDGTTSSLSVSHGTTGVYTAPVTIDADGVWYYRWTAAGVAIGAEENRFRVRPRQVG